MANERQEGFAYGLKGLRKAVNWARGLGEEAEKVKEAAPKVKLAPRQRLQVKMQQAAKEPTAEEIAQMQHQQRVNARISKNAGDNKGLEHNLRLKQKYAESKFGKEFQDKLIREYNFTPEGAARVAHENQLNTFNQYLKSSGRTPVNLTRAEAEAINKEVASTLRKGRKDRIQNVEKLAERYNRMYPKFSPKGAAYIAGGIGGTGLLGGMVYNALTSGVPEQSEQSQSKYRYTSNNGWEKNENGKWSPQQKEFGIDRNGNVNYYDGQDWVSDYIQDSNGTIYNRQGQVIGSMIDPIAMHASGYDNIFDYNAAQAGIQPEQVAALQQALGVIPDGKWGARTQAAYEQAMNNIGSWYNPDSLFSIYQRKMQYGY